MTQSHRHGFTLVELLVVIAIIGILMSLAVPGVLMARAAARKTHCLNNQGQLAIGLMQYEGAKGNLPPYVRSAAGRNVAWPVLLFEYIDQPDIGEAWEAAAGKGPSAAVPLLVCPASGEGGVLDVLGYGANVGVWDGTIAYDGVFTDGTRKLTSDKITGGSEHAMAFAENLQATTWSIDPDPVVPITDYVGDLGIVWMDEESRAADCNDALNNDIPCVLPNKCRLEAVEGKVAFARPSSVHSGGAGMAFVAGRAQFINDDVDPAIYKTWMLIDE